MDSPLDSTTIRLLIRQKLADATDPRQARVAQGLVAPAGSAHGWTARFPALTTTTRVRPYQIHGELLRAGACNHEEAAAPAAAALLR
jgi:hypothetical protein